ncbi:MAG: radical SAM protein [Candidatus Omnitrophota bacterium]
MIRHIFGPVASRRLGISLGVDIIPYKTCSLDCLYCECGKTTDLTLERQHFVDPQRIVEEVKTAISGEPHIDYITFSGSGEPTLNKDIGTIIAEIKTITPIPIAVITNGTLLYLEEVREAIAHADLVLPSLDAVSPDVFSMINRPHPDLRIDRVIDGLIRFRQTFQGTIWMEVFIARGINDTDDELGKIHDTLIRIQPDKVQLNSLDRPPAYENVHAVDMDTLERIMEAWKDLPVEIIRRTHGRKEIRTFCRNLENNILNTIERRPMTIEDLNLLTGKNKNELFKYIDVLEKEKKIFHQIVEGKIFYSSTSQKRNESFREEK